MREDLYIPDRGRFNELPGEVQVEKLLEAATADLQYQYKRAWITLAWISQFLVLVAIGSLGVFLFIVFRYLPPEPIRSLALALISSWGVACISLPIGLLFSASNSRARAHQYSRRVDQLLEEAERLSDKFGKEFSDNE